MIGATNTSESAPQLDNENDFTVAATPKQLKRYSLAFALTTFGIGPAFGSAITYMSFQIQQDAFWGVGHHPGFPPGTGCPELTLPCRVPLGKSDINLTSLMLYLNAIGYGVSGFLTLLICGWGDHMRYKREQYILWVVAYGALILPAAGLTHYTRSDYNSLVGLYTSFNVVGFLAMAWMNIFVPYTMQKAAPINQLSDHAQADALDKVNDAEGDALRAKREREGLKISIFGGVSMNVATVIFYLITIGLSYASMDAQKNAGLYMTSAAGAVCIFCALAAWRFLPAPAGKAYTGSFLLLPLQTFAELWRGLTKYRNAMLFLLSYAIYNDSHFAFATVIGNLFNLSVRPSMVEFTAYSIAGTATSIIGSLVFLYVFPYTRLSLRHWAMISCSIMIFTCFWCCLGMSANVTIGFKHRAEFYVFHVLQNIAGCIISSLFRVLFPEMFPRGNEIQYFGFQLVLSCATTWIPQVVNGPIVDKTNNQRLPAVVSMVFFFVALGLVWLCNDKEGIAVIRREEVEAEHARQSPRETVPEHLYLSPSKERDDTDKSNVSD